MTGIDNCFFTGIDNCFRLELTSGMTENDNYVWLELTSDIDWNWQLTFKWNWQLTLTGTDNCVWLELTAVMGRNWQQILKGIDNLQIYVSHGQKHWHIFCQVKTIADDSQTFLALFFFSVKIRVESSCESSSWHTILLNCQALKTMIRNIFQNIICCSYDWHFKD